MARILTPISGIYNEVLRQINNRITTQFSHITTEIHTLVRKFIWNDNTTRELLNPQSKLVGVLGLDNARDRISAVIEQVCKSTRITFSPYRIVANKIRGDLTIELLPTNFRDIINLPESDIDGVINWAKMLLVDGAQIYSIENSWLFKPQQQLSKSRTSHSLIVMHSGARAIRVPIEFIGTRQSNWLTKALNNDDFIKNLESILVRTIL